MSHKLVEQDIENLSLDLLEDEGYDYIHGSQLAPDSDNPERERFSDVVLVDRLKNAIDRLNPSIPSSAKNDVVRKVLNLPSHDLVENNEAFYHLLINGVKVGYRDKHDVKWVDICLIDFDNPKNNEFVVCNQFTVEYKKRNKRPDIILFVNGLPLVVIELKNPLDEKATVRKAYDQLQNYKEAIPQLFYYNAVLVASDGLNAKAGSLTANWERFMRWKVIEGKKITSSAIPQVEILIKGMLRPDVLLEIIKDFTVFESEERINRKTGQKTIEPIKKVAAYHQYLAVNKALQETLRASGFLSTGNANGKIGVVWHTQGSGKSLSMVFYAGKSVLALDNPTLVIVTDRNDLDNQLFGTFGRCKSILRQTPIQVSNRKELKSLLKTAGGGIVFTTIQKFFPDKGLDYLDILSERKNIVVIADEAHRTHYGFKQKTRIKDDEAITSYGYAKYLRDALPNVSFIGFTGTPIEKEDRSTPAVFGKYIDVYDVQQAIEDGATVPIYYESRLVKINFRPKGHENIDLDVEAVTEFEESTLAEKAKAKWAKLEAIVGHKKRIKDIAKDIIEHFGRREITCKGKAMIVAMSRRIAIELYDEIVALKPEWHDKNKDKGVIKVIMTTSSSDPKEWQPHQTNKKDRDDLAIRFKDPNDNFKLAIVRDMWLTGFDVPCLHTLYVDKQMQGHTLMQAIARVNRVYKDKRGGLVVDYIGIASNIKTAVANYTENGGEGSPVLDIEGALSIMLAEYEIVQQMFTGFNYQDYFAANTQKKLQIILEAQEHILSLDNDKERFIKYVGKLSKSLSLVITEDVAQKLVKEIGFFQAVRSCLLKFESRSTGASSDVVDTAIKQIVDQALVTEGIIDVFKASGIKKPDISILSDEFLAEVRNIKQKHLRIELLKKLLNDEIKIRSKRNLIQSKKFSEMLVDALKRYHNNLITTAEIIELLIDIAKDIRNSDNREEVAGLSKDEIAFYDALANNDSAKEVLGDETLREIACVLVKHIKENVSVDWTLKESVQARMRVIVKRFLRKYGYPPDKQAMAIDNVLEQAKLLADEWSN